MIDPLVSDAQSAFVGDRQILDAVLVAYECIESRLGSGIPRIICKLDNEKAYDHVNRDFIFYLLRRMGFGDRWCRWMKRCVSTVNFSALVNGVPEGFFSSSRSLRQGNSLSPFLFILVKEAFSRMKSRTVQGGLVSSFTIGGGVSQPVVISYLLFAHDTIIFSGATVDEVRTLRLMLVCFEVVSGLRIRVRKSEMFAIDGGDNVGFLAEVLGCTVGSLLTIYPGLPLGAKFKPTLMWDPFLGRVQRRLAGWKHSYLSRGEG